MPLATATRPVFAPASHCIGTRETVRISGPVAAPTPRRGPLREREIAVLQLVAEGYDTGEIARKLSYSERTIKKVLHDLTMRLQLRNRSHAVAYALRAGLI